MDNLTTPEKRKRGRLDTWEENSGRERSKSPRFLKDETPQENRDIQSLTPEMQTRHYLHDLEKRRGSLFPSQSNRETNQNTSNVEAHSPKLTENPPK